MREHTRTLTPTLSLSEGEGAISMPSPGGSRMIQASPTTSPRGVDRFRDELFAPEGDLDPSGAS